jgi:ribosomal protein S18 acetylase RimI-like enzyme
VSGTLRVTTHDTLPPDDARAVDEGLGDSNDAAAPLHEVVRLGCFAREESAGVVGGALGRTWGGAAELQQLWVDPAHRRRGLGERLVRAFEQRAAERGCTLVYLETFSFQAPAFYGRLGYREIAAIAAFPHGIVKYTLVHDLGPVTA